MYTRWEIIKMADTDCIEEEMVRTSLEIKRALQRAKRNAGKPCERGMVAEIARAGALARYLARMVNDITDRGDQEGEEEKWTLIMEESTERLKEWLVSLEEPEK